MALYVSGETIDGDAASDQRSEAGAPGEDIEVTPQMAAAGTLTFLEADRRIDSLEEIMKRVFRAMVAAR